VRCRVVVATHPQASKKSRIGHTRKGVVYELFFTHLPQDAFTASDVVALYLHRGAYAPTLADEDLEQDPDRWCSHSPAGQEAWQIINQWVWNLRLELGHRLHPDPLRTVSRLLLLVRLRKRRLSTPPLLYQDMDRQMWPCPGNKDASLVATLPSSRMGRCAVPASQTLRAHERRKEGDGSLRVVYAASIHSCRPCPLREQCQWNGKATGKPRQVSVLLHPLVIGSAPLLWRDWSRREHRRACMQLVRDQHIEVRNASDPPSQSSPAPSPLILSRAQRAH
jgi:hypothetical protein